MDRFFLIDANLNSLYPGGLPGLFVDRDDGAGEADVAFGGLEGTRRLREELLDNAVAGEADDPLVGAGHASVRQVRRATGPDRLVRGRHVRVRADYGRDTPVQIPADGHLLRSRLPVHVHQDDFDVAGAGQLFVGDAKRGIGMGRHEDLALEVQDADRNTRRRGLDREAAAGIPRRIVGGPQEAVRGIQRVVNLLLVPDVVAGGEDVDWHAGELREELVGQPEPSGRVLDVDDRS